MKKKKKKTSLAKNRERQHCLKKSHISLMPQSVLELLVFSPLVVLSWRFKPDHNPHSFLTLEGSE